VRIFGSKTKPQKFLCKDVARPKRPRCAAIARRSLMRFCRFRRVGPFDEPSAQWIVPSAHRPSRTLRAARAVPPAVGILDRRFAAGQMPFRAEGRRVLTPRSSRVTVDRAWPDRVARVRQVSSHHLISALDLITRTPLCFDGNHNGLTDQELQLAVELAGL
jgi:hypothetical protein